jgi:PEP-CTERM motif
MRGQISMRISIALFLAAFTLASTSNAARAVTWVFSGHVDTLFGSGNGANIGDLITGVITFNENATSANLRSDSTPQSAVYEDIISYMRIGSAIITNGGIHPDPTVLNIYSNSGIDGDDGFAFGYNLGAYYALVFGVRPLAMGSVINTLTPSATPFDISLFPTRNITLANDGNGFGARLESLSVETTPLPPTWTMMILGLCGLGFLVCRRKDTPVLRAA